MSTKITPRTPGPSGKSLELAKIPARHVEAVHEQKIGENTQDRYKGLGGVPNRKARRALGRAKNVLTPRASLTPYEK